MSVNRQYSSLFRFQRDELMAVVVVAVVLAFGLTFRMWGDVDGNFDATIGLTNLLLAFLGLVIVVLAHEAGHKIAGVYQGYEVKIRLFTPGIVGSGFVTLYAQGYLPFVTPNLVSLDARPDLRLGKFRKYDNPAEAAMIAMGGLVASILMIFLFSSLFAFSGVEIFRVITIGAVMHAILGFIPFELLNALVKIRYFQTAQSYAPGDGLHLLWWSKYAYVFSLSFIVLFGGFAVFAPRPLFIFSLILAVFMTWAYSKWLTS